MLLANTSRRSDTARVRTCLHCVLGRAVEGEREAFVRRGMELTLTAGGPAWLPVSAPAVYRQLSRMLRAVRRNHGGARVKVSLVDASGTPNVLVLATVVVERRTCVLELAFPRHREGSLSGGFTEALAADG